MADSGPACLIPVDTKHSLAVYLDSLIPHSTYLATLFLIIFSLSLVMLHHRRQV